ncbi:MAG: lysophospholipase [bacterium]|nr:lysophospholipase [bacterium]
MEEFILTSSDGLNLHGVTCAPSTESKASVSIVHGIGEHIGRYETITNYLNQAGYATVMIDLRGHGKSEGKIGHSPSYENLLEDVSLLLNEAIQRFPAIPQFLLGHSMGGALILNYCLKRKPDIAGVISLSPGLRTFTPTPGWKISLAHFLRSVSPSMTLHNGVKAEYLTREKKIVEKTLNDPLYHFKVSAHLGLDVLEQGEWTIEHADEWALPLLLMHGTGDRLTSCEASKEFASRAGKSCALKLWDGLYHELQNEPEKEKVLGFLVDWLNEHVKVS